MMYVLLTLQIVLIGLQIYKMKKDYESEKIRTAKGITQLELATMTGLSKRTIEYMDPRLNSVIKVAEALEVSLDELCLLAKD